MFQSTIFQRELSQQNSVASAADKTEAEMDFDEPIRFWEGDVSEGQASSISQGLENVLPLLGTILSLLQMVLNFQQKTGSGMTACNAEKPESVNTGTGPDQGTGGTESTRAQNGNAGNIVTPSGNTQADRELQQAVQDAGSDPEVSGLLATAQANGYTIQIGDPNAALGSHDVATCPYCQAAAKDGGTFVNGVTLSDQKLIIINPNAPDIKKTLAHELVHAATENDGDSLKEEAAAEVVGRKFSAKSNGMSVGESEQSIADNKRPNYAGEGLSNDNGILGNLFQRFGIRLNFN